MARRTPLPSQLVGVPFSVARAGRLGVSDKRLRAADLEIPFSGVRAPARRDATVLDRCAAYAQRMRPCEVFTHRTAAILHGLPVRPPVDGRLDVGAFTPSGLPRAAGVRGHRVRVDDVRIVTVRGRRVVSAVDAWCQLAAELSVRELVIVGDALMRRNHPMATLDDLRAAVARHAGRRGHRSLAEAMDLVRPRTDSPAETELRLDVMAHGLPEPQVNLDIFDAHGRRIAIGDLAYAEYRVLVEYDGEQHRTDDAQYARDVDRLDDLARAGWRVVRVNRSHRGIRRTARLERVREALLAAGWTPNAK